MVDFTAHTKRLIARLGRQVSLTPAGGVPRAVNAIFTSRPGISLGMSGYSPTLRIAASDGAGVVAGDGVVVGTAPYVVTHIDDDAQDAGDILLHLAAA